MTAYKFTDAKNRKLRIRAAANDEAEIVDYMQSGTDFEAEKQGKWLKLPGGYVMAEYCECLDPTPLDDMTITELRKLAKDSGIKLKSGMGKAQIIEALLDE